MGAAAGSPMLAILVPVHTHKHTHTHTHEYTHEYTHTHTQGTIVVHLFASVGWVS